MTAAAKRRQEAPHVTAPDTADTDRLRLRRRLSEDPGLFEPSTAFHIGREEADARYTSAIGVEPAAVPLALSKDRAGAEILTSPVAGFVGPLGVLPPAYDDAVLREERNRSYGLRSFLDVFAERIAELFFAAMEKYRLPRAFRWAGRGGANPFLRALFSLTGFGTAGLKERAGVDEDIILRFAGLFAHQVKNAANLEAILKEFFGLPIRVEQFRPRWLTVARNDLTALGANARLGINTMAGSAVRDRSSSFRIVVGPLGYRDYLGFAPGKPDAAALAALTRLFVGIAYEFDIQVILRKEDIPFSRLGASGDDAPRLGWNSWSRLAPAAADSEAAFYPERAAGREALNAA
ncbi:type VI secretion system baseplate subunit TssG [Fulvimarina sp. MAC8]|uniref:type VI secretion system baseplate subunit TssG n=1 Tax=Fulvimarina sp. MAC8 TaxID=3162874 RepID=UPI0032EDD6CE